MLQTVKKLKNENKHLSEKLKSVQHDLEDANQRIGQLEQYSRLDNLIITGLPVRSYAEASSGTNNTTEAEHSTATEETVIEFVNSRLGIPLTKADISVTHRLKPSGRNPLPPPVIVRFTNRMTRNAIYAVRRSLKENSHDSTNTRVYINEDLTKSNAEVFRHARKLVKDKKIFKCWTAGGVVFVKPSAVKDSKPVRINTMLDLNKY